MFKFVLALVVLLIGSEGLRAQPSESILPAEVKARQMISEYRFYFLAICTNNFAPELPWTGNEVCDYMQLGLDKRSMIEIDSLSNLVREEIAFMLRQIDEKGIGDLTPNTKCVLQYCFNKSESEDVVQLAKAFAVRMKEIPPHRYWEY